MDVGTGAGQKDGPPSDAAVGNRAPVNSPNSQARAAMAFHFPTQFSIPLLSTSVPMIVHLCVYPVLEKNLH